MAIDNEAFDKLNKFRAFADAFLAAVVGQNADALRGFFAENAIILWHNSNEHFTADEYVRANCEYPGEWCGELERIENDSPLVMIAKVWTGASAFRVVSLVELSDDMIIRLDEYWGGIGEAPQWRADMRIGRK
jgi:hypothetical protein